MRNVARLNNARRPLGTSGAPLRGRETQFQGCRRRAARDALGGEPDRSCARGARRCAFASTDHAQRRAHRGRCTLHRPAQASVPRDRHRVRVAQRAPRSPFGPLTPDDAAYRLLPTSSSRSWRASSPRIQTSASISASRKRSRTSSPRASTRAFASATASIVK